MIDPIREGAAHRRWQLGAGLPRGSRDLLEQDRRGADRQLGAGAWFEHALDRSLEYLHPTGSGCDPPRHAGPEPKRELTVSSGPGTARRNAERAQHVLAWDAVNWDRERAPSGLAERDRFLSREDALVDEMIAEHDADTEGAGGAHPDTNAPTFARISWILGQGLGPRTSALPQTHGGKRL
jgi:hypothetical protein